MVLGGDHPDLADPQLGVLLVTITQAVYERSYKHYLEYGPLGVACALQAVWDTMDKHHGTKAELLERMRRKVTADGHEWFFREERA